MGGNMKAVLVAAVAAAVVMAATAQGYVSNKIQKDGISIRKCDFPFQWSCSTGGVSDAQMCNGRVYCVDDAQSPNNPWYLLQSRTNNKGEAFNKNYQAYEMGFGESLVDDYWLGLWCLQKMTGPSNNELLVRVVDKAGTAGTALYSTFSLGLPSSKYQLRVEGFDAQRSDVGNSMNQSNGMQFTTFDQDNDRNTNRNCAEKYNSGWWYNDCKINTVDNFLDDYFAPDNERKSNGVRSPVVSTLILFRSLLPRNDRQRHHLNRGEISVNRNTHRPALPSRAGVTHHRSPSFPEPSVSRSELNPLHSDQKIPDKFFFSTAAPEPRRRHHGKGPPEPSFYTSPLSPSETTKKSSSGYDLVG